jgi:glycosyltransferase involved in cell wall biosynthesis
MVVVDVSGGDLGGAARWRHELDGYLAAPGASPTVSVVGRGRRVTAVWLVQRERLARRAPLAVAPNNVSFVASPGERRVLLRNVLHFLHRSEDHLLDGLPRSFRAQVPVVRRALVRADTVVVPCSAMAERVAHHVPSVEARIVVRPHPVTVTGRRRPPGDPFVLIPVVPAPYKNLVDQLRLLLGALERLGSPLGVRLTAGPSQVPADLAGDRRLDLLGPVPHGDLAALWSTAAAVFYPSMVEAFGYPLAEARATGVPVIAPATDQAREIAGPALLGYDPADPDSLVEAVGRTGEPVVADPEPFDRDRYFRWLLVASGGSIEGGRTT